MATNRPDRPRDDRRSRRTRRLVTTAMAELLVEMPYDQITIQAILDRADIGRATFYSHFRDKFDVVDAVAAEMFAGVVTPTSDPSTPTGVPAVELFRHAAERSTSLRAMLDTPSSEVFWRESQAAWSKELERAFAQPRGRPGPAVPPAVTAQFVTGAFLSVLKWWLREGMPYTPEQMAAMTEALMPGLDRARPAGGSAARRTEPEGSGPRSTGASTGS